MKVKSESEVAQLCLTLSDPVDCSLPGSSVHGTLAYAKVNYKEKKTVFTSKAKLLSGFAIISL